MHVGGEVLGLLPEEGEVGVGAALGGGQEGAHRTFRRGVELDCPALDLPANTPHMSSFGK